MVDVLWAEQVTAVGQRAPGAESCVLVRPVDDVTSQALREGLHVLVQVGFPLRHWRSAKAHEIPPAFFVFGLDRLAL